MNKTKRWKTMDDADAYIRDLEEVYGMDIQMDIMPAEGFHKGHYLRCVLKAWWKGDDSSSGPLCYHYAELIPAPNDVFMSNLVRALTDFTYQCLEAYISAIPSVVVVRVKP